MQQLGIGELAHAPFWGAALEIVLVDLLLSGDNAVIIAMACRGLPRHQRKSLANKDQAESTGARGVPRGCRYFLLYLNKSHISAARRPGCLAPGQEAWETG